MADLLIKGMDMPQNCRECRFGLDSGLGKDMMLCRVIQGVVGVNKKSGKTECCPLVKVPTHGRLIDLDAALDRLVQKLGIKSLDYLTPSERAIVDVFVNEMPGI